MHEHDAPAAQPRRPSTVDDAGPCLKTSELIEGRYRIERELGRGAMGVVYEATDTGLGRRVALKVITRELASDPMFIERFQREAKALAAIRHQNVVQVHALGEHEGARYYAMEFVQGRTLESVLAERVARREKWPARDALQVLRHVASGLSAVHAARIIHRDVKPANILIEDETGRPVLIDFGIARPAFDGSVRSTLMVGSPAYMAPEQIHAQKGAELTQAADLYALGCVAYELLTLRPPFNSSEVYEVLRDQVSTAPAALSTLRPELQRLDALVARLLAKRPDERPAGCLAVVRELDRLILELELTDASPLTPTAPRCDGDDTARVLLASADKAFLSRARAACGAAFRDVWEEVAAGLKPESAVEGLRALAPTLALVHCDDFHDGGVGFIARLREIVGAHLRVIAFGASVDALDRWRLGGLGISEVHDAGLAVDAMARLVAEASARTRSSGLPGARRSAIVWPRAPASGSKVPLELFLLVIASVWSGGEMPALAGTQVIDAAVAEGHGSEALAAIERACLAPIELADVDVSGLSGAVCAYAYAFATWLALLDGSISPGAESTLHVLAFVLGLPVRERTSIQSAVEQASERDVLSARTGFRYADYTRLLSPRIRTESARPNAPACP